MRELVETIITEHDLTVDRVLRDGPRYWVGLVRQGQDDLILKVLVGNDSWTSPRTGIRFTTADLIQAEIDALSGLNHYRDRLAGDVPRIIASSGGPNAWTLREQVPGTDMSGSTGSLIFRDEFFELVEPEQLADYILSYQALTSELGAAAAGTPQSSRSKMMVADLVFPPESIRHLTDKANAYIQARAVWHEAQAKVVAHGEVYPPHIFATRRGITLIDWENFSLCNPISDFMQTWVRAFQDTSWQERFERAILDRIPLDREVAQELWDIEKVYQSGRNLNYLYYSDIESEGQKRQAEASFIANIKEVLDQDKGAIYDKTTR